jgi:mannosyltransferase OCH1-like enzyme
MLSESDQNILQKNYKNKKQKTQKQKIFYYLLKLPDTKMFMYIKHMIPKVIHQIFWDFNDPYGMPSNALLRNRSKLQQVHSGFTYKCWNKHECGDLVSNIDPHFYEKYRQHSDEVQYQCAKFLIMYCYGGVYFDMDIEPVHSIEPLLKTQDCGVFLFEKDKKDGVSDACFACVKQHPHIESAYTKYKNSCSAPFDEIFKDIRPIPIIAIDNKSRQLVPHISKKFISQGIILLPAQTMFGTSYENSGFLYGIRKSAGCWRVPKEAPRVASACRQLVRMT